MEHQFARVRYEQITAKLLDGGAVVTLASILGCVFIIQATLITVVLIAPRLLR
jgi:hypothetical protein